MQPRRSPWAILLALLLLAAAVAAAAVAAAAEQAPPPAPLPLPPPTVFLHLSDIHYSVNVHKYWRQFGDREGDAALFAQRLVPRLGLAGACITGDLTDSKTARGEGLQQEAEWAAYARLLTNLSAAGVPEAVIWDVPGNHDRFNMPLRGGANDFYATHSAQGRRSAAAFLQQQPEQPGQQEQQRVHVHQLPQSGGGEPRCPAAWMVGLDPTPDPGLRSPTNFAGLARPAMLVDAHQALLGIQQQQPAGCGPPLIIAYCHYPLSTIDSTGAHLAGPPGILAHATYSALSMQGLTKLLAHHNVSAVLSGHLHSSFGQQLHRVHATPSRGYMAELETAAWKDDRRFRLVAVDGGALTFAELHFHTRSAPLMLGRSDAAAMQDPVWQAAYAERGWAVTALDPNAAVIEHIVLISSPPDGRYSPLGAATAQQQGDSSQEGQDGSPGWVRALVFPLEPTAPGSDASAGLEVELSGYLPGGVQLFSRPMQLHTAQGASGGKGSAGSNSEGPLLFAGLGEITVSCVGRGGNPAAHCQPPAELVFIQVSVKSSAAGGSVSRSPRQPAALRCAALTASHQRCWVAPVVGEPLPLNVSLLEWMGLAFNWPVLVHRQFLCLWAFQVGMMLIVPRLLASRVVPLIAASPLLQCHPEQQLAATPRGAAASSGVGPAVAAVLRAGLGFLLWPVAALFVCASITEVWSAMLAYSLYLLVGPWLLYTALSGYPPALLFHFGVLGKLDTRGQPHAELAGWHFIGTPDTLFISLVHTTVCVLPATLWVACVVARRVQLQPYAAVSRSSSSESTSSGGDRRRMEAGGPGSTPSRGSSSLLPSSGQRGASTVAAGSRWSFSGWQLAALAGIAAFNWAALYRKAASMMGASSLLLSPGFAWTLPLAALLVILWGSPRRPGGGQAAAKGE